jgi:hypothetical protein
MDAADTYARSHLEFAGTGAQGNHLSGKLMADDLRVLNRTPIPMDRVNI